MNGTLKGFDQTINLILDESHERVFSSSQGVEQELNYNDHKGTSQEGEASVEETWKLNRSKMTYSGVFQSVLGGCLCLKETVHLQLPFNYHKEKENSHHLSIACTQVQGPSLAQRGTCASSLPSVIKAEPWSYYCKRGGKDCPFKTVNLLFSISSEFVENIIKPILHITHYFFFDDTLVLQIFQLLTEQKRHLVVIYTVNANFFICIPGKAQYKAIKMLSKVKLGETKMLIEIIAVFSCIII
ncbi:hypothetical protein IHE44_0012382 [Lamprotornis superbus]|uniref:Sm domain-containing protein n=1 Tax=Lamprotornis superbus TaxID=245042 RepID=A0A835NRH1_9PASS|nr:hypothetical protein IHE44_0012382 [Lamprotornis superbus]